MKFTIPLLIFSGLIFLLSLGLRIDPTVVPSVRIGKPMPAFSGTALDNQFKKITQQDLLGKSAIVSFWATWCVPCLEEHSLLMSLAKNHQFTIYGINYKDNREAANDWIQQSGNPYSISIDDGDGRIGLEWGVYKIPEMFVVDSQGVVRQRFLWPVTENEIQAAMRPLLKPKPQL